MTGSLSSKHYKVIQGVYAATKAGNLTWATTSKSEQFLTNIDNYTCIIRIVHDPVYPEEPDYAIELYDDLNVRIESISNRTVSETPADSPRNSLHPYTMLKESYELARRQAMGVDIALDTVLNFLKSD